MKTKRIKALPCKAAGKIKGYLIPIDRVPALAPQMVDDYNSMMRRVTTKYDQDMAMVYALKRVGIIGLAKGKAKVKKR